MMAKIHASMWLKSACLATTFALMLAMMAPGAELVDDKTQDIIYLNDGRVLHGQIVSEDSEEIIFLYLNAKLRIETRMPIKMYDVNKIDRDVPMEGAPTGDVIAPEVTDSAVAVASTSMGGRSSLVVSPCSIVLVA